MWLAGPPRSRGAYAAYGSVSPRTDRPRTSARLDEAGALAPDFLNLHNVKDPPASPRDRSTSTQANRCQAAPKHPARTGGNAGAQAGGGQSALR